MSFRNAPDDREPQRFLGMPRPPGGWRSLADNDAPRVMGVPHGWIVLRVPDLRWIRHPLRWTQWRLDVRRRGAYAPLFDDFLSDRSKTANQPPAGQRPQ